MRGRLLSQGVFERAALFDKDDFLCVAATNRNTVRASPDTVRALYDAAMAAERSVIAPQGDPTTVNVPDSPPSSVKLEDQEFQYLGATPDNMHAQGPNGSVGPFCSPLFARRHTDDQGATQYLFLGQTATMFLIAQTPAGVNREAAQIIMNEFQRSLVDMPLGQGL